MFSKDAYFGEAKIKLDDLANGCVRQVHELKQDPKKLTKSGRAYILFASRPMRCISVTRLRWCGCFP